MSNEGRLNVGAKIKDNDPRMGRRVLTIVAFTPTSVVAEAHGRLFTYARHRIHTDGKPRKSGLSLVSGEA